MEEFQWGGRGNSRGEKIQGIRSITGRHKIDRERLRMVYETEKSKKLHKQPVNMNQRGGMLEA